MGTTWREIAFWALIFGALALSECRCAVGDDGIHIRFGADS